MAVPIFDCIVAGVGGIGSAALYHLARRGARVLGIDQYPPGHDKGSSHGDTRAIRLVYFEHPDYVPLLRRAFDLWKELDAGSAQSLFHNTGILQAGPRDGAVLTGLIEAARVHDLPLDMLTARQVAVRFPGFEIDDAHTAIFDPNGGLLRVEDCIIEHTRLAQAHGATFQTPETVRHWYVNRDVVIVETDRERYTSRRLVITPGPWAARLLPKFSTSLHLLRKSLFWFDNEDDCYRLERGCPVFLFEEGDHTFYGFPSVDDKGIKIADHAGGTPLESPASLDHHVRTDELEAVSLMMRHHLPRAGHQLNHHATCIYTMSADGHFLVGRYPGVPQVHIVAGLSGHGFKFATVLGEIMADLTLEGRTAHPIDFLSPTRFAGVQ